MSTQYLHIDYRPKASWLLKIMTKLHCSESQDLQLRMENWGQNKISEFGISVATKLAMLRLTTKRVDTQLQKLSRELEKDSKVEECIQRGAAFPIKDKDLAFEILVNIDSFLFESRSAYEIVGQFLREFFNYIFKRTINETRIKKILEDRKLDNRWIGELHVERNLFIHEAAPWIALQVKSKNPLNFELLILKENITDFSQTNKYYSFNLLRDIYKGFASSMDAIQAWIMNEIDEWEATNKNP